MRLVSLAAAVALLAVAGCQGQTSSQPPLEFPSKLVDRAMGVVRMDYQPKLRAQEASPIWPDGFGVRPPPAGTVARGFLKDDDAFYRGLDETGKPLAVFPVAVDRHLVLRGRDRFDIYCAVCHDRTGSGEGLTPTRGWVKPPSFHDPRILALTPGELYQIVSNGIRTMPGYAAQVPEHDRWAIVSYVQALQQSFHVRAEMLPAEERSRLP
jgi:mono/diheme cytochrome c family protein